MKAIRNSLLMSALALSGCDDPVSPVCDRLLINPKTVFFKDFDKPLYFEAVGGNGKYTFNVDPPGRGSFGYVSSNKVEYIPRLVGNFREDLPYALIRAQSSCDGDTAAAEIYKSR